MPQAKLLKNGMRVHLVPFSGTQAATVLVLVKVGSRYESLKVWGGSHFIEHLMFKGTKKRPKTIDISKTLDRYGALYNAYTGKNLTGYYVKIDGEQIPVAIDLLHDMLFNSKFEAKEMTREKKVIVEELKMYEENPIMHLEDLLEEAVYHGNTLSRDIGGSTKSVLDMKRSDVLAYRDEYYVPSEMVVVVAGNVPKNCLALLNKTFGSVKKGKEPTPFEPFALNGQKKVRVKRQYKNVKQIQIGLGFPTVGMGHDDLPAIRLLANILGGTMSSRLFVEVRERRGLAYAVRAKADVYEDAGVFMIRAGLDANRLELAAKTIVRELKKVKQKGVTAQELTIAKDNIEGGMKLALENSSDRAEFVARQELFFHEVKSLDARLKKLQQVKKADVNRVAKEVIDFDRLSIAAIGPYKTDAALLKHFPVLS